MASEVSSPKTYEVGECERRYMEKRSKKQNSPEVANAANRSQMQVLA